MSYDKPYAGVKIVDVSQGIAAPYCAMLFAQYGAEVIKVEPPGAGDWSRGLGETYSDHSAYSIAANLGKRSIALDLKAPEGKEILWRLLKGADVFLESFRTGAVDRLGFGYDAVSEREPQIIYLSVSGFGRSGPMAERPAMDPVLQAFSGLMADNKGADGLPHRIPIIPVDMTTALYGFQAVSAALYGRRGEARGRYLDVNLMQGVAGLQVIRMMAMHLEGGTVKPGGAPGGVFETTDGWINLSIVREEDWNGLCQAINRPELARHPNYVTRDLRLEHADPLYAILRPLFASKPAAHWGERLAAAKVMHERLNSYDDFLQQPQVAATGLIGWLPQTGMTRPAPVPNIAGAPPFVPGSASAKAPLIGEHSEAILRQYGYSAGEIADFRARGIVGAETIGAAAAGC